MGEQFFCCLISIVLPQKVSSIFESISHMEPNKIPADYRKVYRIIGNRKKSEKHISQQTVFYVFLKTQRILSMYIHTETEISVHIRM